jgi:SAM-dependent methyltransferase
VQTEEFFNIFLTELESNIEIRGYYKFLNSNSLFEYRKAYFCQRLNYINNNIADKNSRILDIGCGYGTTGIFLALNGYSVLGTTLEYYYEQISKRIGFWSKYGDTDLFKVKYENLFDDPPGAGIYDIIILQDVLHHLEPLPQALDIIKNSLSDNGKLIVCEENGNNVLNNLRLFFKRGNKKVIKMFDERLKKDILIGNENIRNAATWENEFNKFNLTINKESIEYIRLYPPFVINKNNFNEVISQEQNIWRKNPFLKKFFYHGINFTVENVTATK